MARLNVNPNRMELSRLKKRLVVAKRGHKLLKDKQDALIKAFLERARAAKVLREELEDELKGCYKSFLLPKCGSFQKKWVEWLSIDQTEGYL